jgi:hypothetical protein
MRCWGFLCTRRRGCFVSPRFVIPVCFGFAIAGALAGHQMFGGFRRAGVVFLAIVSAWFVCRESCVGYWYREQKECFYKVLDRLPEAEAMVAADAPIAIPDPLLALTFHHYAPAAQARREVFSVDFPAVREFRGDDSPEENLWAGRGWLYALPIETVGEFEKQGTGNREQGTEKQGTREQGNEGTRRQGLGNREQATEKQGQGIRDKGQEKPGEREQKELELLEAGWETKGWDARAPGTFLIIAGEKNWMLRDLAMHHYAERRLPMETRAAAIGGFTPLAHGVPEFFAAQWTAEPARAAAPFREDEDVPAATKLPDARELDGGVK